MYVIIAGAGEVGAHAASVLSSAGHNVTVLDLDAERLRQLGELNDLRTLQGHCAHIDILRDAGVDRCDLLIAATQVDEINLLAASMAKAAGARKTIVRVHHTANFSLRNTFFSRNLGIDELICPEYLTSLAVARTVRNPGSIALEEFAHGKLLMQRVGVSATSPAAGKRLADLKLPERVRIATVERGQDASIGSAGTVIETGDFVTLIGESKAFETARKQFDKGKEKRIDIAIMGGTSTAVWLCRAFRSKSYSVRLFVESHERAEELSEKLDHVTVLCADPTEDTTFVDEHMERVDTFIAVTDEDERNILACVQAKQHGATTVIAVIQRSKYLPLLSEVGIDRAFSPRDDAVKALLHMIDSGPILSLATFAEDLAEVYELKPSRKSKVMGNELRNIRMPSSSMIAAMKRGEEVYVPRADDHLAEGDTILVLGPRGISDELLNLFVKK